MKHRTCQLLCILTMFVSLTSCSGEKPVPQVTLRPVRVQQVFAEGGGRVRMFSGVAEAGVESKISFKVSGTIQQIHVRVGNRIRKGDLIAELDAEDYRLKVQDADASLRQAKAQDVARVVGIEAGRDGRQAHGDGECAWPGGAGG